METPYKYIELDASKREETDCKISYDKYKNETCSPLMGLAGAAHSCYNKHCVLVVSPDDFWLTFLTAFMDNCKKDQNKAAAETRLFENGQAPEGKIRLDTRFRPDTIAENLKNQAVTQLLQAGANRELVTLIMDSFTSSRPEHDLAKAMCVLKSYEEYTEIFLTCMCGIPAVKMMGSLADWEKLAQMVKNLRKQADLMSLPRPIPAWWWDLAQDICQNLIVSYEESDMEKTVEWWSKIISDQPYGSGGQVGYGGWLSQLIELQETRFMPVKTAVKHFCVQLPVTYNGDRSTFTVEATSWPKFKTGELGMKEMGVNYRWSILSDDEPMDLSVKKDQ